MWQCHAGAVKVTERFVASKSGDPDTCEDGLFLGEHFVAVVDGATDKSGRRFGGMTGGRYVMQVLIRAMASLPREADMNVATGMLTERLAAELPDDVTIEDRPSAAATLYSAKRREIWQIGDVGFWFDGSTATPGRKEVDRINSEMRAAVLRAEILSGVTTGQLATRDPGREAIKPLLTRQALFANNTDAGPLGYAVFDGRPIPAELVTVVTVPAEVTELVLASDGYPEVCRTLADSEARLKTLLAEDPLCVGPLAGTKGVASGNQSYDDRAYLRLEIQPG